jgi:cysteine synthase
MSKGSESNYHPSHGVGGTPLVRLRRIAQGPVEVHVKCEWMNPAGSVKDRPALWMIRDAEDRGLLRSCKEKKMLC